MTTMGTSTNAVGVFRISLPVRITLCRVFFMFPNPMNFSYCEEFRMQRYDHGGDIYVHSQPVLDFSSNINPLGYPPGLKDALVQNIDNYQRYPDAHCRKLKQAIAAHHGISEDQMLCGNGASDLIYRICAHFRSSKALIAAPTFSEYERGVYAYGGHVKEHLLKEDNHFDVDDTILNAITPDIRVVFLCSPNNPTGRLISVDLLQKIAGHCQESGAYLVLDECFLDFTTGKSMIPFINSYPNLLILRAFTKMYAMAGLRLGYLLSANQDLLDSIAAFGATWSVSGPAQVAGLASLSATDWTEITREYIKKERAFMHNELQALGLKVFTGEANYLLLKSEQPLFRPLLEKGILVRDCGNYTGLSGRFIRIGIQTRENNIKLLNALKEVHCSA